MRSPTLIILGMLLVGCGIDRGGAPNVPVAPSNQVGAIDTLIVGSIDTKSADTLTIDGISIDTSNALIRVDGAASALDLLQPGQYAVVRGSSTAALGMRASAVDVDTEIISPASAFDDVNNTLTILAQQVTITDSTVLDDALSGVVFNDVEALGPIRVSGIADGLGRVWATYIAPAPGTPFRLTGFASQVDEANLNFSIGQLSISYANALVVDLNTPAPVQNSRVALTGQKEATTFTVETIVDAPLIPNNLASDARIQLTAAVTLPLTDDSFAAGFAPATLTDNATFTDGDRSNLVPGTIVTVQGIWNDAGHIDVTAVRIVRAQ